ncbi:hypothetical protein NA57DRAFT_72808 [Rhizodiscina lignyota]|uniref:Uncharacterized protein n=1 Tax=Rhizodiscina lignyota TaxID=1504668 RepID=A0A9P4M8S7_9PEZI|nr:hypothetical protein NA57DRAFT_72808 [Rhizodiscina lignyota]
MSPPASEHDRLVPNKGEDEERSSTSDRHPPEAIDSVEKDRSGGRDEDDDANDDVENEDEDGEEADEGEDDDDDDDEFYDHNEDDEDSDDHDESYSDRSAAFPWDDDSEEDPFDDEDEETTEELLQFIASEFESHRRELAEHLRSLRDRNGAPLYSEPQIQRQLSTEETDRDTPDRTFEQKGYVGIFSDLSGRRTSLWRDSIVSVPVREILDGNHEAFESWSPNDDGSVLWVHLPANNIEWVVKTMVQLCVRHGEHFADSITEQTLRRELHTEYRAAKRTMPVHARNLRPSCRKIRVLEHQDAAKQWHNISFFMPYLHWEHSLARYHAAKIVQDAERVCESLRTRGSRAYVCLGDIYGLPCNMQEKLLRYYIPGKPWLHVRRTLDQSYYVFLKETEARDRDQVVERYSRKMSWPEPRVLMVDQLWLWILNENVVLTCFPGSWTHASENHRIPKTDVFPSIKRYVEDRNKRKWIRNAEELAYCIIDRCAANVFDSDLVSDEQLDFIEIFRRSIADLMDKQSLLAKKIWSAIATGQQEFNQLMQANAEFPLLEEAKDILDELRMIRDICTQQAAVMKKLRDSKIGTEELQFRRIKFFLEDKPQDRADILDDLINKAESAYNAVIHLIDIKQKQANLFQAMSTTALLEASKSILSSSKELLNSNNGIANSSKDLLNSNNQILTSSKELLDSNNDIQSKSQQLLDSNNAMLRASEKSGETMMTFTVITILFLPLSTLCSFFSLNARELNGGTMTIGIVFAYIFPLSLFIIGMSLAFGFSRRARDAIFKPFTKKGNSQQAGQHQNGASGTQGSNSGGTPGNDNKV